MDNQEPSHNNGTADAQGTSKPVVVVLIILVLGVLLASALQIQSFSDVVDLIKKYSITDSENTTGLHMVLAEPGDQYARAYIFDVEKRKMLEQKTAGMFFTFKDFSPNGSVQAFIGAAIQDIWAVERSDNIDEILQVYVASGEFARNSGTYTIPTTRITNVSTPYKFDLSVRNDGVVLYSARGDLTVRGDEPGGLLSEAKRWSIYTVQEGGEPQFLVNGTHPKWVDGNRFIYLGENGLYMYDIEKGRGVRFLETSGTTFSNVRIDLSDDNSIIVWNNHQDADVTVIRVNNWGGDVPEIDVIGSIPVAGFWVAISPDSSTVAVQAVDWENLKTDPRPRIEFYSVDTLEKVYDDYPLNEFDQNRMFLNDWR